ncbi:uncharacterized protein LOC134347461 isoform X3 [Mobula hypostoma]|uniref:uncharacterized protein LOC134347461 isoform X3 n=1 Tax=Mobula hypostoma TaxID=723540 RepID=UPI002FC2DDB7
MDEPNGLILLPYLMILWSYKGPSTADNTPVSYQLGTMELQESPSNSTLPGLVSHRLTVFLPEDSNTTASRMDEGDAIYYILLVFGLAGAVVVFKMLDNYSTQKAINRLPFDFFEKEKQKKKKLFGNAKQKPGLVVENRAAVGFELDPSAVSAASEDSSRTIENV